MTHTLSRHGFESNPPMQAPGIISNIQPHLWPEIPSVKKYGKSSFRKMRRTQTLPVPAGSCCVSLLYIKQLYTQPCVSSRQPPNLVHKSPLTLFVLRILTDYSDTSFSFNNLAFFTNWFYWWSNLHVKSSFPALLCLQFPAFLGTPPQKSPYNSIALNAF